MFHNFSSSKVIANLGFMAVAHASATATKPPAKVVYILQLENSFDARYRIAMGGDRLAGVAKADSFLTREQVFEKLSTLNFFDSDSCTLGAVYLDAYKIEDLGIFDSDSCRRGAFYLDASSPVRLQTVNPNGTTTTILGRKIGFSSDNSHLELRSIDSFGRRDRLIYSIEDLDAEEQEKIARLNSFSDGLTSGWDSASASARRELLAKLFSMTTHADELFDALLPPRVENPKEHVVIDKKEAGTYKIHFAQEYGHHFSNASVDGVKSHLQREVQKTKTITLTCDNKKIVATRKGKLNYHWNYVLSVNTKQVNSFRVSDLGRGDDKTLDSIKHKITLDRIKDKKCIGVTAFRRMVAMLSMESLWLTTTVSRIPSHRRRALQEIVETRIDANL